VLGSTLSETAGTLTAGATKVTSTQDVAALQTAGGTSLVVNGNLQVTGKLGTAVGLGTSNLSEVTGSVTVTGGQNADSFTANHQFKVDQGMTLKLGGGTNTVSLGDAGGALDLIGNLSIVTGSGVDTVTMLDVAIGGAVSVLTGSGGDSLTVDDGAVFAGTVKIDTGGGDDTVGIAQNKGQASAVRFNGGTTILGNTGDDTLKLGLTAAGGGDANSSVTFAAGGVLDGGLGLNTLAPNPQQTGATEKNGW